jgi:hypothetical protein
MAIRLDIRKIAKKIQSDLKGVTASEFRPELARHAKRTLDTAARLTPQRNLSVIRRNQAFQYDNRTNYIPSIHELIDPTLIVKDDVYWLYANGKWWAASYRELPDEISGILATLVDERERRLATSVSEFVAERAQARFLYRKSWWQVGRSIGVPVSVSSEVQQSHSRPYHDPASNPPQGYGQWRGGKHVLSVVIYNPLLQTPTKYFHEKSGKEILAEAAKINHPAFMGEIAAKLSKMMSHA